ncbi:MAG: hypothetical protein J6W88_02830 [Bacteroidales bacterium]|nr:hypothetical protein [Bacteroidales bacterium]
MKRLFLLLSVLILMFFSTSAQDLITLKNGTDIKAKVLEVNPTDVTYKLYTNPDGPTYKILRSDILLIRYENGTNEVFDDNSHSPTNNHPNVVPGMRYSEYCHLYDAHMYIQQPGDPYSRGWAGVASFFIPGLGECVAGEWGRGLCVCAVNVGLYLLMQSQVENATSSVYSGIDVYDYSSMYWVLFCARLGLNIWSIWDAVHVAKIKNMYNQDLRGVLSYTEMHIEPFLTFAPDASSNRFQPAAGLSLSLSF